MINRQAMNRQTLLLMLVAICLPFSATAQENATGDPLLRTVNIDRPVYFFPDEGDPAVAPAGDYWVGSTEGAINLIALTDSSSYRSATVAGTHDDDLVETIALSISGTEEEPDTHIVVLMFADGRQLAAQGSYSGIQPRGLRERAKAAADAARKRAQQAALARQRAAAQARQAALAAANRAREIAQNAGEQVVETAQNVAALPGAVFQGLLAAASEMQIQELLVCLSNARDSRTGNIRNLATQFANDPASMVSTIIADVEQTIDVRFDELMATVDAAGDNPSPAQLIDASFSMMQSIGADRPAFGCLMKVIEPRIPQLKRDIARMHAAAETKLRETFDRRFAPLIDRLIGEQIEAIALGQRNVSLVRARGPVGELAVTGAGMVALRRWERENMASGLYARSMAEQFALASEQLETALAANPVDPEQVRLALVTASTWSDDTAYLYALRMLRYRGHRSLDIAEGIMYQAYEKAVSNLEMSDTLATNIMKGLCGLVPEAGAAVCVALHTPLKIIWNKIGRKALVNALKSSFHMIWSKEMDVLEEIAIAGRNRAGLSDPGAGLFGGALRRISRESILEAAENDLPDGFRQTVDEYNENLDRVINQWITDSN